jgi:hypothetical protein
MVATMTWLTIMECLCHKWPWICSICLKHFRSFPHSWLITGFVTRLTRRVPLVEQEPLNLLEHLSSPPVFSGIRVTRSLVLCVCFLDRCLPLCTFSFGHCVFCLFSIYWFCLPLWYLQTPVLHHPELCNKYLNIQILVASIVSIYKKKITE